MANELTFTKKANWYESDQITDQISAIQLTFAAEDRDDNTILIDMSLDGETFAHNMKITTSETSICEPILNDVSGITKVIKCRNKPESGYYLAAE